MALKLLSVAALAVVIHAGDLDFGYQGESYSSYAASTLPYSQYKTASIGAYSVPIVTRYATPITNYAAESPIITKYDDPLTTYAAQAPIVTKTIIDEASPAAYDFEYAVEDPHSGDSKIQQESRRGDVVRGRYSLIEPDGTKRTVEYVADHNGFNAAVHKEPLSHGTSEGIKTLEPITSYAAAPAFSYAAAPATASVSGRSGGYDATPVFGYTAAPSIAKISAPAYGYSGLSSLGYADKIYSPGPTVYSPSYGYH